MKRRRQTAGDARRSFDPTPRETEILQVLWELGPSTVRVVHAELAAREGNESILRTTVLKHMQIMLEKGLVSRDDSASPQLYAAALERPDGERQMVDGFVRRVFDGSASRLILRALDTEELSEGELEEIRRLLDEHAGRGEG